MNPSALPHGTVIRLNVEQGDTVELQRTESGWAELTYHCVDCAATWTYESDGLKGDHNSTALHLPEESLDAILERDGTWEVVSVPAEWLAQALQDALSVVESDAYYEAKPHKGARDLIWLRDRVRNLAVDAGLS